MDSRPFTMRMDMPSGRMFAVLGVREAMADMIDAPTGLDIGGRLLGSLVSGAYK